MESLNRGTFLLPNGIGVETIVVEADASIRKKAGEGLNKCTLK